MSAAKERVFEDKPGVRGPSPLLFGLIGPSGSGKTFSALRLATGIQRVTGGEIFMIDTESRRALHYAERFKFRHVEFRAPFAPPDYEAALAHCVRKGASTIIVDSMSHEHEGPGGVLEWHAAEVERLLARFGNNYDKANVPAWNVPKTARRHLINAILQMQANFIFCFRAKEKIKIGKGEVKPLGWMPIAGEEFVYELTAKALLLPGAYGTPTWNPENDGEKMMVKLPEQFRSIFTGQAAKQLDEDTGEQLARWAAGDTAAARMVTAYVSCADRATFEQLEQQRKPAWGTFSSAEKVGVKRAVDEAAARLGAGGTQQSQTAEQKPAQADALTLTSSGPGPTEENDGKVVFDEAKSIAALRGSKTMKALTAAWAEVGALFPDINEIPLPVEAAYQEMRESLAAKGK